MADEIMVFWLIHFFIGLMLPAMAFLGCCKNEREATAAAPQGQPPLVEPTK